jgi:DNA-binding GntR family transcriptional regulator
VEELILQHEEIFRRISRHEAREAAEAMRKHLLQTRNDLRAAFASGSDA